MDTVSEGTELLVEGSFDFAYYVQLHLDFRRVEFTNIADGSKWPDAWYGDQLFLMEGSDRDEVCKALDLQIDDNVMLFRFNSSTSPQIGLVAARSLSIHWYSSSSSAAS